MDHFGYALFWMAGCFGKESSRKAGAAGILGTSYGVALLVSLTVILLQCAGERGPSTLVVCVLTA